MLTGKLWPVHPHPLRDELLSSWLVRLAHANGCKVQTFCHIALPQHEIWNRDIDRSAPEWLLKTISRRTGTPPRIVYQATLRKYEGWLFERYLTSGSINWIISLKKYHRQHLGYSVQFCPQCLANDPEPYFRVSWRLGLYTFCPDHQIMMHDRCPECAAPIVFHRQELGKPQEYRSIGLYNCFNCGFDLRYAVTALVTTIHDESFKDWSQCLRQYSNRYSPIHLRFDYQFMAALRHLCSLICNTAYSPKFQEYLCDRTCLKPIEFIQGRIVFEQRSITERHQALLLAWWLLADWPNRLYKAWYYHAVRYNLLLKDLDNSPEYFSTFIKTLNRNQNKSLYKVNR